jgi:hypothetical protein
MLLDIKNSNPLAIMDIMVTVVSSYQQTHSFSGQVKNKVVSLLAQV